VVTLVLHLALGLYLTELESPDSIVRTTSGIEDAFTTSSKESLGSASSGRTTEYPWTSTKESLGSASSGRTTEYPWTSTKESLGSASSDPWTSTKESLGSASSDRTTKYPWTSTKAVPGSTLVKEPYKRTTRLLAPITTAAAAHVTPPIPTVRTNVSKGE
ncbi:hypothetical protein LSAT2_009181, partial [Lamellibrachia satsuma]